MCPIRFFSSLLFLPQSSNMKSALIFNRIWKPKNRKQTIQSQCIAWNDSFSFFDEFDARNQFPRKHSSHKWCAKIIFVCHLCLNVSCDSPIMLTSTFYFAHRGCTDVVPRGHSQSLESSRNWKINEQIAVNFINAFIHSFILLQTMKAIFFCFFFVFWIFFVQNDC